MNIGHTSVRKGKKVIVLMRNGEHITGKFIEHRDRFIVLDSGRIPIQEMRTVSLYRVRIR